MIYTIPVLTDYMYFIIDLDMQVSGMFRPRRPLEAAMAVDMTGVVTVSQSPQAGVTGAIYRGHPEVTITGSSVFEVMS